MRQGAHVWVLCAGLVACVALAVMLLTRSAVLQMLLCLGAPFVVPRAVVALRFWIFTRLNGEVGCGRADGGLIDTMQ